MNRKMPYDPGMMLIVLALLSFGLVMVFSASTMVSRELYGAPTQIFTRQLISAMLGLAVLAVAMKVDYHLYCKRAFIAGLVAATLLLLGLTLALSPETNGVRRWLRVGPANFQPSELAKLVVVLLTAYFVVRHREALRALDRRLVAYGLLVSSIVALVVMEPDLGTAVCIILTAVCLLFLGGLNYRFFLSSALLALPSFYFLVLRVPYRRNRILAFLDPQQDPYGIGYQIRQSLIAVGSGGWLGVGFAQGKQKLFYLPEPHTDFIFAVIGEEIGLLGCVLMVLLFCLFFWRAVRIALRSDTPFGTYLGLGIACMIGMQAFINMSVVVKLLPTKGIPLPFVSVGGSSMLVMLAAVGILLNISSHSRGNPDWLKRVN